MLYCNVTYQVQYSPTEEIQTSPLLTAHCEYNSFMRIIRLRFLQLCVCKTRECVIVYIREMGTIILVTNYLVR